MESWPEETFSTGTALGPPLPVPVAFLILPVPIQELHVNLFLMGNYLLFGLFMCLFFIFIFWWRGGRAGLGVGRRVGDNVKVSRTP